MTTQDTQFAFGNVEPTAMLGRVVNLRAFGQTACLCRAKGLVKRSDLMRVEVVADHNDFLGLGIPVFQKVSQLLRPIDGRSLGTNANLTPALKGFGKH